MLPAGRPSGPAAGGLTVAGGPIEAASCEEKADTSAAIPAISRMIATRAGRTRCTRGSYPARAQGLGPNVSANRNLNVLLNACLRLQGSLLGYVEGWTGRRGSREHR